jgi:NAD(P)-dependent dehydrogenase (short-subunit alcohol dehydrogenase family)
MEQLTGKVAIVTGAGSGIGRGTALALARAGASLVLVGRGEARLDAVAREIGRDSLVLAHDIADPAAFEAIRDATLARFGRIDIVMNNAAAISTASPEEMPIAEWQRVLDINLMAPVRSNAVFLPILLEQGHGHLVYTASVDGLYGFAFDRLPYAASKAALVQMAEGLALYLRPRGIGVTCLCPGPVATDIMALFQSFGEPHEIRGPGAFLAQVPAEAVGETVVDAIRTNRFLLHTHPEQVGALMAERARDMDAFIDRWIAEPHVLFAPSHPAA